jgi:hypothetical protein
MKQLILLIAVLLTFFITFAQKRQERLQILWPPEFNWKVIEKYEDSSVHSIQIIPAADSVQRWSIMGFMARSKSNFKTKGLEQIIKAHKDAALQESPLARFSIIEKDSSAKIYWVIFKVDTPSFPNDPIPESQLWYVIQSEAAFYSNFVAIKKEKLSNEFISKWTKIFKSSKLEYKE